MRAAPPVSLSCPRDGAWRGLLATVPALAAAVGVLWAALHLDWPLAATAGATLAAALLAGVLAWRWAPHTPVLLAWDGQQWLADGEPGTLAPMIDLQATMLLRWSGLPGHRTGHHTLWLPASRQAAGPAWHALRVAVHARRPQPQAPTLHV